MGTHRRLTFSFEKYEIIQSAGDIILVAEVLVHLYVFLKICFFLVSVVKKE